MFAKVIVDIPSGQTDKLFDYKIPTEYIDIIEKGMRVIVPFGPRKIQGFVIDIVEESTVKNIKSIIELLDVTPVLTEELLNIGKWLAETILCFRISAYQVMLPAAMRTTVKKEVRVLHETNLSPALAPLFETSTSISWDSIKKDAKHVNEVQQAVKNGTVEIKYQVKEKGQKKQEKRIKVLQPIDQLKKELEQTSARAAKQKELLSFFIQQPKDISLQQLLEQTTASRQSVKALEAKGLIEQYEIEVYRDPFEELQFKKTEALPLTIEQQQTIEPILSAIEEKRHDTFLLHGVTGSGKTEVYLQAIAEVLKKGKDAIVLVPEISLTPQMVDRFKGRFGNEVAVLHSGLSIGEKYDEWRKIHRKQVRVVVGARSAIFAPFENLGLVIIDEEHEGSYKQEDNPRYHAREVAIYRGNYHNCPVVLGSATPSLETYARGLKGRYHVLPLTKRVNDKPLPAVEIIDMREELRSGNRSMFSTSLFHHLQNRLEKKEQSVLFLNRRGYSTFVMCRDCGYVAQCEHCDISLTYHRNQNALKCHYCGHEEQMITTCQSCGSEHVRFFGTGTQKVEEELGKLLPEARVIRMDVDTTRKKGAHQKLLQAFGEGKADILLGTQMIAKGLDFPNITLVGVLAADSMLHLPDFRASERTFQLLTQVSGRAGRHERAGEVVIQTYTPEHYSIELVKQHDYIRYFHQEMALRKKAGYPPYYFLTLVTVSHPELGKVIQVTEKITAFLKNSLGNQTQVLGPVASPIPRIKDRYRYQCLIKYKNEPELPELLREIQQMYMRETSQGQLQLSVDTNPQMFM
ncbi:primosomal protein N' [Alkalihalobacillus sp. LMS39]|uniref:primosomal protein N' n=1 Tax=Alkalihalobacillus sp. LMS39 TaxID=2924032 RepID=UPI001FB42148|nr:primosomal protein N' [Alkalihalobacillus sp. LMS39]UOE92890.1 primosomal protein N' [Alkalihalobacillus sp. LMS39]